MDSTIDLYKEFERYAETERKIVMAAVEVFSEKGFDGARTEEIAMRAGVNKAMIHYYFKCKENLYIVIIETVFEKISRILGTHLSFINVSAPEQGIRSFVDNYIDFIYAHRIFVKILVWDLARGGPVVARVVGKYLRDQTEKIRIIFEKGAQDGYLRPIDPRNLFVSIMGMILFFFIAEPVVRVIWGEDPLTPEHIAKRKKEISNLIINALLL